MEFLLVSYTVITFFVYRVKSIKDYLHYVIWNRIESNRTIRNIEISKYHNQLKLLFDMKYNKDELERNE
ncbi:MAG: hypothetical protein ACI90V_001846 [Bacillariaceae sp.]|jgi:hypothetical protein